jgi:peptide deformylase
LARILQHEVDHLNGILFIDRMIGSEKWKTKSEKPQFKIKSF